MCMKNCLTPLVFNTKTNKKYLSFKESISFKNRNDFVKFCDDVKYTEKLYKVVDDDEEVIKWLVVPCGKCAECLRSNSRAWAFRLLKEAEFHENNYFITFTYDDEHIDRLNCNRPVNNRYFNPLTGELMYSLVKDEISVFNKKLKSAINRYNKKNYTNFNSDFRFYAVGEYGSKSSRPHYHVMFYDLPLWDLEFYKIENGKILYTSPFLNKIWSYGYVIIGDIDVGSACYVARYCDKKKLMSKEQKQSFLDIGAVPEFSVMSRNPGIGADYLNTARDKIANDINQVYYKNNKFSIPNYYKTILKKEDSTLFDSIDNYAKLNLSANISKSLIMSDIMDLDKLNEINNELSLQHISKRYN